jgi:uncharacterized protein (DUF1330 family)
MASIDPRPEQFQEVIAKVPKGVPVVMLNLLKFRDIAKYPDDRADISGRDAYAIYSGKALKHLGDIGGELIWFGEAKASVIAPPDEDWDQVFLVKYPSIEKFIEMVTNPSYQKIVIHRSSALKDSRLIATIEQS